MANKPSSFKTPNVLQGRSLLLIRQELAIQQQLTQQLKTALPQMLAEQLLHCVLKKNQLILYTNSANWASQLRFYSNKIIEATTQLKIEGITSVQARIIQDSTMPAEKKRNANIPSRNHIEFLNSFSQTIQDPQLKTAFTNLARTLTRLSNPGL